LQFAEHRQENCSHSEAHAGDSHHNYPVLRTVLVDVGGGAEHSDARDIAGGIKSSYARGQQQITYKVLFMIMFLAAMILAEFICIL
jgi:hypothetical protein